MADITMCTGKGCNMKETCYRYKAKANEAWQTYFLGTPHKDKVDDDNNTICDKYWEEEVDYPRTGGLSPDCGPRN